MPRQPQIKENGQRSGHLIPEWKDDDPLKLETYLAELKMAKALKVLKDENDKTNRLLIFGSLQKSGKTDILFSASEAQQTNIGELAKLLRERYGISSGHQRVNLANIRQEPGETDAVFLSRIEKSYYLLRGKPVPANDAKEQFEMDDLRSIFLRGLNDPSIAEMARANVYGIQYSELAKYTTAYREAKGVPATTSVFAVQEKPKSIEERLALVTKKLKTVKIQKSERRTCKNCGARGHLAKRCQKPL